MESKPEYSSELRVCLRGGCGFGENCSPLWQPPLGISPCSHALLASNASRSSNFADLTLLMCLLCRRLRILACCGSRPWERQGRPGSGTSGGSCCGGQGWPAACANGGGVCRGPPAAAAAWAGGGPGESAQEADCRCGA